jgi:hypothetical protein
MENEKRKVHQLDVGQTIMVNGQPAKVEGEAYVITEDHELVDVIRFLVEQVGGTDAVCKCLGTCMNEPQPAPKVQPQTGYTVNDRRRVTPQTVNDITPVGKGEVCMKCDHYTFIQDHDLRRWDVPFCTEARLRLPEDIVSINVPIWCPKVTRSAW